MNICTDVVYTVSMVTVKKTKERERDMAYDEERQVTSAVARDHELSALEENQAVLGAERQSAQDAYRDVLRQHRSGNIDAARYGDPLTQRRVDLHKARVDAALDQEAVEAEARAAGAQEARVSNFTDFIRKSQRDFRGSGRGRAGYDYLQRNFEPPEVESTGVNAVDAAYKARDRSLQRMIKLNEVRRDVENMVFKANSDATRDEMEGRIAVAQRKDKVKDKILKEFDGVIENLLRSGHAVDINEISQYADEINASLGSRVFSTDDLRRITDTAISDEYRWTVDEIRKKGGSYDSTRVTSDDPADILRDAQLQLRVIEGYDGLRGAEDREYETEQRRLSLAQQRTNLASSRIDLAKKREGDDEENSTYRQLRAISPGLSDLSSLIPGASPAEESRQRKIILTDIRDTVEGRRASSPDSSVFNADGTTDTRFEQALGFKTYLDNVLRGGVVNQDSYEMVMENVIPYIAENAPDLYNNFIDTKDPDFDPNTSFDTEREHITIDGKRYTIRGKKYLDTGDADFKYHVKKNRLIDPANRRILSAVLGKAIENNINRKRSNDSTNIYGYSL